MMSLAVVILLSLGDLTLDLVSCFSKVKDLGKVKDLRSFVVGHIPTKVFQTFGWCNGELELLHTIAVASVVVICQ